MPRPRVPAYRLHKASGQAVVVLRGKSVYLGTFGSADSRARYDRTIARYLATRAGPDAPRVVRADRPKRLPVVLTPRRSAASSITWTARIA